jgi:hypothetical protein
MKSTVLRAALLSALALTFATASQLPAATPAEELAELMRQARAGRRQADAFAPKMLEFAAKNAKDPAAAEALAWVINTVQLGKEFEDAADMYAKDHAASDKAGSVLGMLGDSDADAAARCLRAILAKNQSRSIQSGAAYNLALWLYVESERLARLDEMPASLKTAAEAEKFYTLVIEKYSDSPNFGKAKKELNTLKTVAFGKVVPEITGEDHTGAAFKLSDYRGKVVAIVFWGDW